MTFALSIVAILLLGVGYQTLGARADRRRYPPPGSMVGDLHVRCAGHGPPVVLEAGIAASSVGWTYVEREISEFARACSYDRPGFAWSLRSRQPRTPESFVAELDTVVRHAGVPAVLVGHSFGAYLIQLYAREYPEKVAGLVLVDPPLLRDWTAPTDARMQMLRRGVSLSKRGALLARLGFVRLALACAVRGAAPMAKLFSRASSGRASSVTERLVGEVRKLPPELWPVVQSHWCRPESFLSMAEHLACLPSIAAAVGPPPSIPTVVVSGSHLKESELEEHRRLGRHVVAEGSGHWVHLDRPDAIAAAVKSLLYG